MKKIICPGCKKDMNPFLKKLNLDIDAVDDSYRFEHDAPCRAYSIVTKVTPKQVFLRRVT